MRIRFYSVLVDGVWYGVTGKGVKKVALKFGVPETSVKGGKSAHIDWMPDEMVEEMTASKEAAFDETSLEILLGVTKSK